MRFVHCLRTLAASSFVLGISASASASEPAARIDVARLPQQSQLVDEVVVPVPSEIFAVLDKLGKPRWSEVLVPMEQPVKPTGDSATIALRLGTIIAEGFVAVEAENVDQVKKIGRSVLALSKALSVDRSVMRRANAISELADLRNWAAVRAELDGALREVKTAMAELNSEQLAQLVSLGGWIRGTEALAAVVAAGFTKDGAELLHQPILVEYFQGKLPLLREKFRGATLLGRIEKALGDIRPLMGVNDGSEISEKSVKEILAVTGALVGEVRK
jgi:hypothetical protein